MGIETVVFLSVALALSYIYALYPALLLMLQGRQASVTRPSTVPSVSVIVPFHNEERWVARKLDNTLEWDYPADRLQIIGVSDGSNDSTASILKRYEHRVTVVAYEPRRGKPTALNAGVARATGHVLVFTDANVLVDPDALRSMTERYSDASVGGVSGHVALQADGSDEPLGEGFYMRYERWLYELDSRVHTMVGADGALFSIRRALFSPLAEDTVADDFDIALGVIAKGGRVVYEPHARGVETVVPDVRAEFRRKVRMIAGGYQTLWRYRALLNPLRRPTVTFQLASHKLLRWLVPGFMFAALVASVAARHQPVLAAAAAIQLFFYALALAGWTSRTLRRWTPVYVPYYFCAVNVAAAVGFWRYLVGRQAVTWQKVQR